LGVHQAAFRVLKASDRLFWPLLIAAGVLWGWALII
jgi:hypothetical protein